MKLQIRKFDPSDMKPHRIILLVGRRGVGKSVLMRDLMERLSKRVDFGLAMTPTEDSAEVFRAHMPEAAVYSAFEGERLERMLAMQRALCRTHKQRALFVLMDDCMYDKRILRSVSMRDLFMNGRHMNVTFCNAMQARCTRPPGPAHMTLAWLMGVPPPARPTLCSPANHLSPTRVVCHGHAT